MSEQTPPAPPDGGAGNATPAPAAATPAAPAASPPAQPFVITKDEWLDFRRELRSVKEQQKGAAPAPPATPPDAMAAVEELRTELALRDAFDAHKVAAGNPLRELIATAVKASKPPDLAAFVAKYAGAVAAPVTAAPPAPVAPSNTGAPAETPSQATLPENPLRWPADVVRKMGPVEFRKALNAYDARSGQGDPLHALRPKR